MTKTISTVESKINFLSELCCLCRNLPQMNREELINQIALFEQRHIKLDSVLQDVNLELASYLKALQRDISILGKKDLNQARYERARIDVFEQSLPVFLKLIYRLAQDLYVQLGYELKRDRLSKDIKQNLSKMKEKQAELSQSGVRLFSKIETELAKNYPDIHAELDEFITAIPKIQADLTLEKNGLRNDYKIINKLDQVLEQIQKKMSENPSSKHAM